MMASRLRTPTLAITGLSMCLALAVIGTAGRSLHVFYNQQKSDPWLLPLWPGHFETGGLQAMVATSAIIFILNATLALSLLIHNLPANILVPGSSFLGMVVAVISVAFSTVKNHGAPYRDTLQTWTCRWNYVDIRHGESVPEQFHGLCHKTRFAYYTMIPLLVLQVFLFAVGLYVLFTPSYAHRQQEIEKQQHGHQLNDFNNVRAVSLETKSDSAKSYLDEYDGIGIAQ